MEESNRNPDSNAASTGNHQEAPKPVPGGVISAENNNEREDERKWAEEIEEENRPKRSKSDLEGSKPVFLRKTRRTRSSGCHSIILYTSTEYNIFFTTELNKLI